MVSTTNLVSYYKCDDNGTFPDAHGSNNGTISGAAYTSSGKINGAYSFDGADDYINIFPLWDDIATNTQGTVNMWLKTSTDANAYLMLPTNSANNHSGLVLSTTNGGTGLLPAYEWNTTGTNIAANSRLYASTRIDDGAWHMVTWWSDGSTNKIFVDGVDEGILNIYQGANTGVWWNNIDITVQKILLGTYNGTTIEYTGLLDELSIFNVALSQTDITNLYNSGSGLAYPFSSGTPVFNAIEFGHNQ